MASEADVFELVRQGDRDALAAALAAGADPDVVDRLGMPVVAEAAGRGDLKAVTLLLEHGARLEQTSAVGNSALMLAAARGHGDMVRLLLERGADPTVSNKWGFGPRDWGTWSEKSGEVLALLDAARR